MNKAPELEGRARRVVPALALALLFAAPGAFAWNDTGHLISALIAYDALPETTRAWAVELLRAHPRFREDFEARLPARLADAGAAERGRWYFARAGAWADYARRFDDESEPTRGALIARFSHGSWHYVNLPLYLSAADERSDAQAPPSLAWSPGLDPSRLDIVQAMSMLTTTWCEAPVADRALALSWLLHLMADLHQPLHTTAMFGAPAFLRGDRGGNDVPLDGGGNLHALWDGALGAERRFSYLETAARASARAIATRASDVAIVDAPRDFAVWAADGRDLAARDVYTEAVRAAMAAATPNAMAPLALGSEYRRTMRADAQRQIVLAGRRTAALLDALRTAERSDCRR
ncbi:MAG TPA: S1/P1 nuclease [Pseudomonadales bacterium]|nr:S1/P1 nuclease [Pseudomonadales bacterium]